MTHPDFILIKNGLIIDPANGREAVGELAVAHGKIVPALTPEQEAQACIIDATGKVVSPGLVDLNAHIYQPGKTARETFASGTAAAAAGGFTTIVCTPDEKICIDNAGTVRLVKELIDADACVTVLPAGNITLGGKGESLAPIGALKKAGCVAITDSVGGLVNNEIMRCALDYSKMFDVAVFDHCQDSSMTATGVMHMGAEALHLGLRGLPRAAEDIVVSSDILLCESTSSRLHLQHISSGRSVELIRDAKKLGTKITAEVSPQHLFLTDKDIGDYDTNKKINPPLREESDRRALIAGLKDGTIDAISSDHSPRTPTEKDCEFDYAPFGVISLETALAVSLEALYHCGEMTLPQVLEKLTVAPAKILGIPAGTLSNGADADIMIFDPNEEWIPEADSLKSNSRNCAVLGRKLRGRVVTTVCKGKIVFRT
ncbi:MAG: dihydroorotase [Opitutales bacterium]|nr:dihydroorotase [Opitutales bacterium]